MIGTLHQTWSIAIRHDNRGLAEDLIMSPSFYTLDVDASGHTLNGRFAVDMAYSVFNKPDNEHGIFSAARKDFSGILVCGVGVMPSIGIPGPMEKFCPSNEREHVLSLLHHAPNIEFNSELLPNLNYFRMDTSPDGKLKVIQV